LIACNIDVAARFDNSYSRIFIGDGFDLILHRLTIRQPFFVNDGNMIRLSARTENDAENFPRELPMAVCVVSKLKKASFMICLPRQKSSHAFLLSGNITDKFIHGPLWNFLYPDNRVVLERSNQWSIQHDEFIMLALSICNARKIFRCSAQRRKCCVVRAARIRFTFISS